MKYEVVIFDADGVLFDFDKAEECALERVMTHYKIDYDPEYHLREYKRINTAVWDEFEKELISAEELKAERFRRFFKKMEISLNPEEISSKYMNFLSEAGFLLDGATEILDKLKNKVRLVLITNGLSMVQRGRLKNSNLSQYFQKIIISEEVGVAKPNPHIFKLALEEIEYTDKEAVLMVGDSLKSDIRGGFNFGINTCWFNPTNKENHSEIKPTFEINDLNEINNIVQLNTSLAEA